MKNEIVGTGWTDTEGTAGKATIKNSIKGQKLPNYKKVRFPGDVEEVTVKFDSAGGSAVKEQSIEKGAKATKPADPKRSGYTFNGWYKGSAALNFNTAVNENMILTAHWKQNVKPTPTLTTAKVNGTQTAKITAKAKGTCTVYVFAHNGVSRQIKVKVK